jgi:hypothetical protein
VGQGPQEFTHSGFNSQIPTGSTGGLGSPGRFDGGNDTLFTFAIVLMMMALLYLNGGAARQRDPAEEKGGRRRQNGNGGRGGDYPDAHY